MTTPPIQDWQTDRSWGLAMLVAFPLWASSLLVGGLIISALEALQLSFSLAWWTVALLHLGVLLVARSWGFARHRRLWRGGALVTATVTELEVEDPELSEDLRIHVKASYTTPTGRREASSYWIEADEEAGPTWRERLAVGREVAGWVDPEDAGQIVFSRVDVVTIERRVAALSALTWLVIAVAWWFQEGAPG